MLLPRNNNNNNINLIQICSFAHWRRPFLKISIIAQQNPRIKSALLFIPDDIEWMIVDTFYIFLLLYSGFGGVGGGYFFNKCHVLFNLIKSLWIQKLNDIIACKKFLKRTFPLGLYNFSWTFLLAQMDLWNVIFLNLAEVSEFRYHAMVPVHHSAYYLLSVNYPTCLIFIYYLSVQLIIYLSLSVLIIFLYN